MSLIRPPIVRSATGVLDRSLFAKTIPLAAARIFSNKNITKLRTKLEASKDILTLERLKTVRSDPDAELASKGTKCILLNPKVRSDGMYYPGYICFKWLMLVDPTTWSPILQEAVKERELGIISYSLNLDYDYWEYCKYIDI